MASADTNVLLRLLVRDDEKQYGIAKAFLDAHAPLYVSKVALSEAIWVLTSAYGASRDTVCDAIETLADIASFRLEDAGAVLAALAAFRGSKAEFSDCLILETARAATELPLATFDRRLGRLAGTMKL